MIAIVVMLLFGAQAKAATPVDFSGTWTYDAAKTAALAPKQAGAKSEGGSAGMLPPDVVIEQTATSITFLEEVFGQTKKQVFNLTGADSTNHSGAVTSVMRSHWTGASLVTEGKQSQVTSAGYDEWHVTETRSIDKQGAMVVQNTWVRLDGVAGSGAVVYVRKAKR